MHGLGYYVPLYSCINELFPQTDNFVKLSRKVVSPYNLNVYHVFFRALISIYVPKLFLKSWCFQLLLPLLSFLS